MINLNNFYMEFGGAKNGIFTRNHIFKYDNSGLNEIQKFIEKYDNTDIYNCIYLYSDDIRSVGIENVKLYAPFYLDMDAKFNNQVDLERIRPMVIRAILFFIQLGLDENDIQIYFSGSKGFHILIPAKVLGIEPSKDLNAIYKAWAIHLYKSYKINIIDLKIYDKRRLFRIPNSINHKTGLYKVPMSLNQLYNISYEELIKYASAPKEMKHINYKINLKAAIAFFKKSQLFYKKQSKNKECNTKIKIPTEKKKLLPCIEEILSLGAAEGNRNNTLVILASGLLQSGYTLEETLGIAENWNLSNTPPLSDQEINLTTKSAYSMLLNGMGYGCSSIKEMGLCSDNECKLGERDNGKQRNRDIAG